MNQWIHIFPLYLSADSIEMCSRSHDHSKLQNSRFHFRTNCDSLSTHQIMCKVRWLRLMALAIITLTITSTPPCAGQSESLLRVGKAINVFIRYGYLSISMKVISYNDTERWIFKEPTRNVFQVRKRRVNVAESRRYVREDCWFSMSSEIPPRYQ